MPFPTLAYKRLAWPVAWEAVFGRPGPLLAEIGFGNGDFLVDLARRRPEANILGLEISLPSLRKAERKTARLGLDNIRIVQAPGQVALWLLCAPASLQEVFINFPDPWPKKSHAGRRIINDRFLHLLATRTSPGARLDIATDHHEYARWIGARLQSSPHFENTRDSASISDDPDRIQTKYELKARASGLDCHFFRWRRNGSPAADIFVIPQESEMPHAIVRPQFDLAHVHEAFEPFVCARQGLSVRFIDMYRSARHESLLADVFVSEEPMDQRLLLSISSRKQGEWLVNVSAVGFPRPTAGVHYAARCLLEWLQSLGSLEVVNHALRPLAPAEP